jgi:hypothetical protein
VRVCVHRCECIYVYVSVCVCTVFLKKNIHAFLTRVHGILDGHRFREGCDGFHVSSSFFKGGSNPRSLDQNDAHFIFYYGVFYSTKPYNVRCTILINLKLPS